MRWLLLGAILFAFGAFLVKDIKRPWVEYIDFNGAVWSQAAHNILRAGLIETQGASAAFYFGPLPIPRSGYYLHHPPLLHLGVTAVFVLFGEHEWAARMIPIACSLASAVLLWLLVSSCLGPRAALFCTAMFASLPMTLYYGTMVNFEPVVLSLMLLALLSLRYWEQTGRGVWKTVFYASILTGLWVDWGMHLFCLVLFVWWMARPSREGRRMAWWILAMALVSSAVYLIHTKLMRPDALQDLQEQFVMRVTSDEKCRFTAWQWVCKVTGSIARHYMPTGLIGAALGGVIAYRRRKEEGFAWIGWASLMVFVMDAIFVGVFQNDSYIHEYIAYYFVVPAAVLAGIVLNETVVWAENAVKTLPRGAGNLLGASLVLVLALLGQTRANALRLSFNILDLKKPEPETLIPNVGEVIQKSFSPETRVLCNFMPYYSPQLEYYAEREVAANLGDAGQWKHILLDSSKKEVGGIVWMGDEDAPAILSGLPPGKKEFVRIEDENFCVWKPQPARVQARLH